MAAKKQRYPRVTLPVVPKRRNGRFRKIGVEIEFTGLSIARAAKVVRELFGGTVEVMSDYEYVVKKTEFGDFTVELDYSYLKKRGQQHALETEKPTGFERFSEDILAMVAKQVVPIEIVTPPMSMDALGALNVLCTHLAEKGAEGTDHSAIYAFGVHLNPELPDMEVETILAYIQAFLLLYEWLLERCAVDTTRKLTAFADPFPKAYVQHVLAPDYQPSLAQLIDDYLIANCTRNRALDMLPLFAYLEPGWIAHRVKDDRIGRRPTLHYRLPNSRIGSDNWQITDEWETWLAVENLAYDPKLRSKMAKEYLQILDSPLGIGSLLTDWAARTQVFLAGKRGT